MAYRKLGRDNKHRRSMLATLTKQLIETYGKKGTVVSRRLALAFLHNDKKAVDKVFNDFAVRYKDRNGGYTRIIKMTERKGDSALEVILELV